MGGVRGRYGGEVRGGDGGGTGMVRGGRGVRGGGLRGGGATEVLGELQNEENEGKWKAT